MFLRGLEVVAAMHDLGKSWLGVGQSVGRHRRWRNAEHDPEVEPAVPARSCSKEAPVFILDGVF
ncbi:MULTISPECIES: hypothetical protein [Bradyrhizobium]|uniref:Uncharacterized protein n=1 Tax=Bradyrhizobium uaiense TaxID=2594946 RepID=A0A6P1BF22_9BRAD|nr:MULTISPECIES: hypothetical protein [Bradyrhizobium]MCC8966439.1 hypothetical protein [Bradyrhizobium oropedii]NEU97047.1 hypothetical protein [Bradyrhizobium uaiense]